MTSIVPLANDKHANLKVVESGDYSRYRGQNLIPVVMKDFFTLAAEFPLVFVTQDKPDEFVPVAIMGLRTGQNLYCEGDQWPAQVIPVSFGNAPFNITRADPEGEQFVVLVDEDSPLLSETEGNAIFTEDGTRTEYMEKRIEHLVEVTQQAVLTQNVCRQFRDQNLLVSHQVQLQHRPDGTRFNIDGIHIINEQALNDLSDDDFLTLRKQGLLPLIYAHLSSLQQLRRISQLQYEADQAAKADKAEEQKEQEEQ
ncbi:MAG: SapC family protein [Gammaproteobacteria bacterium]|nr:SapC family protein [Gammaproteobacteria bacterium]